MQHTPVVINIPDVYSSFSLLDSSPSVDDESLPEDIPSSPSPPSLPSLPTLLDSLDVGDVDTELSPAEFTLEGLALLPAWL